MQARLLPSIGQRALPHDFPSFWLSRFAVMEAICGIGEKTGCDATPALHGATAADTNGSGHEVAIG
jgi:hypothetical protein